MTIPEFLAETKLTFTEIARACGVNVSQVYRWASEDPTLPNGAAVLKLIALSGNRIKPSDVPVRKRKPRSTH